MGVVDVRRVVAAVGGGGGGVSSDRRVPLSVMMVAVIPARGGIRWQ